jgi:hypothetical protein
MDSPRGPEFVQFIARSWFDPLRQVFLVGSGLWTVCPCIVDRPSGTSYPWTVRELDTNRPIFKGCILEVLLAFSDRPPLTHEMSARLMRTVSLVTTDRPPHASQIA